MQIMPEVGTQSVKENTRYSQSRNNVNNIRGGHLVTSKDKKYSKSMDQFTKTCIHKMNKFPKKTEEHCHGANVNAVRKALSQAERCPGQR